MASSASDFNEPEFLEYDPTPYGGGYDIAGTYGKPLPPSNAICYPHSEPKSSGPKPLNGSLTPIDGRGMVDQATSPEKFPLEQAGPDKDDQEEKPWSSNCSGNWLNYPYCDYWAGDIFSNGYGSCEPDQGDGTCSGAEVPQQGYDYNCPCGWQKSNSQFGYSRDDLGPCAALFDYWPCLYRKEEKSYVQHVDEEDCYGNQWKGVAEYLFGSLSATGERREEAVNYGYQKQYLKRPYTVQFEYNEQSRTQNMSFCEAYLEEPYEESNYGEEFCGGNDEYFQYQQLKHSYYDE